MYKREFLVFLETIQDVKNKYGNMLPLVTNVGVDDIRTLAKKMRRDFLASRPIHINDYYKGRLHGRCLVYGHCYLADADETLKIMETDHFKFTCQILYMRDNIVCNSSWYVTRDKFMEISLFSGFVNGCMMRDHIIMNGQNEYRSHEYVAGFTDSSSVGSTVYRRGPEILSPVYRGFRYIFGPLFNSEISRDIQGSLFGTPLITIMWIFTCYVDAKVSKAAKMMRS